MMSKEFLIDLWLLCPKPKVKADLETSLKEDLETIKKRMQEKEVEVMTVKDELKNKEYDFALLTTF